MCRFLCLFLGLFALGSPPARATEQHTIAIVPQFSASQLRAEWQPLLERLGAQVGVVFELGFHPTIPAFEAAFLRGEADFIFANPYHAVMARRAQGYVPLVRDRKPLTGILVVASSSPARTLRDLAGRAIAFPAPNAFGASLYMRALLAEGAGIDFEARYVKTHLNVYRQVATGDVAAGGGINLTLADIPPSLRAQLRILYETPGAAPHPLAAHPRVDAALRARVTEAVLALARDPAGLALLSTVRMAEPVAADYARDYAPLEGLKLDQYVVMEQ